jgi:hypothetical protein
MVPVATTDPQPPVNGILYGKVPDSVGDPETVIILFDHEAVTPAGSPVAVPIPVAPVVVRITFGSGVLTHTVGLLEGGPTVLVFTVILPVAFTDPQPPVKGIL